MGDDCLWFEHSASAASPASSAASSSFNVQCALSFRSPVRLLTSVPVKPSGLCASTQGGSTSSTSQVWHVHRGSHACSRENRRSIHRGPFDEETPCTMDSSV